MPQHRERIIIVGFDRKRYGKNIEFDFKLTPEYPKPVMRDNSGKKMLQKNTHYPINSGHIFKIMQQSIKRQVMDLDMALLHWMAYQEQSVRDITRMVRRY